MKGAAAQGGGGGGGGGGGKADSTRTARAAELSAKIMIGLSAMVKSSKGDCPRMAKSVGTIMKANETMRLELMELYKDGATKAEFKAARDAGKYPELDKDFNDSMAGATECPDAFSMVDRATGEVFR
jgi:hypothetical protein